MPTEAEIRAEEALETLRDLLTGKVVEERRRKTLPCPKWPIHFMDFIGGVNGPVRFQDSNGDWWDADSFDYGGFTNAVKWEAI